MGMGYLKIVIFACLLSLVASMALAKRDTKVLVVGMIHNMHEDNPYYSYEDVYRIIRKYDPDAVCMEIRPQEFRRHGEFPEYKEMIIASLYALKNGKDVCPIDWFPDGLNYLKERRRLTKTPEYVDKIKRFEKLSEESSIIRQFEERHPGLWEDKKAMGYSFVNGKEYNEYQAEVARIKLEVFGDDVYNANYITRNGNMFKLIEKAIDKNRGKRIIVIAGASHKHVFDEKLSRLNAVKVVDFESMLPLASPPIDPDIADYIVTGKTELYYQENK